MTATLRRPRVAPRPSYTVVQWHQRWQLVDGAWFRQATVRRADGALWTYLIRDDVEAAA